LFAGILSALLLGSRLFVGIDQHDKARNKQHEDVV
jgi:hypothetical protein